MIWKKKERLKTKKSVKGYKKNISSMKSKFSTGTRDFTQELKRNPLLTANYPSRICIDSKFENPLVN